MKSIFTLSVLSIVTALSLSACGEKDQPETPTTTLPVATESTPIDPAAPVDAKVSTQDIGAAYGSNAKEAEKKLKGKKLEIVGTIADIRTDGISDLPEVILKLEQANKGVQPRVTFADSEASKVSKLKKGQNITIICKGGEQFSGMAVLENCLLVP